MSQTKQSESRTKILLELVIVIGIGIFLFLLNPSLVWVSEILALAYIFTERKIRHRSFEKLGIKRHGILAGLRKTFPIIILVAVVNQFAVILGSYWLWHPLLLRLEERVATIQSHFGSSSLLVLVLMILVATLVEEVIFRGFIQERLSWYFNISVGIVFGSLVMTLFHYSTGSLLVVGADLFFVFLDSLLYGLIYMRSGNVFVAWTAHLSADLVGIVLLLVLCL